MQKILVIGSTVADIVITIDALPTTAQDIHTKSQSIALGGCAHNVSDAIRHFGVPYVLFTPVGTGIYGEFVRGELAKKNVVSPIPTPSQANGCCYCLVEASGERTFIVDHGAEYLFHKEWFDQLNLEEYSCVYICGLEIEEKTGSTIVEFLENANLPVFFATGPRICKVPDDLMKRIFALHPILHMNDDELLMFTGAEDITSAATSLYAQTDNTIIITLGKDGACYYDGKILHYVAPVPVDQVVDTIGAGDSHCGSVIACLYNGMSMDEAIGAANKVSSAVVSHRSAQLSDEEFLALSL